jgi:hypothetical protein
MLHSQFLQNSISWVFFLVPRFSFLGSWFFYLKFLSFLVSLIYAFLEYKKPRMSFKYMCPFSAFELQVEDGGND